MLFRHPLERPGQRGRRRHHRPWRRQARGLRGLCHRRSHRAHRSVRARSSSWTHWNQQQPDPAQLPGCRPAAGRHRVQGTEHLTDGDRVTFLPLNGAEHAVILGRHFEVDLVGLEFEDRFSPADRIALSLQPLTDDGVDERLTQGRNLDIDCHVPVSSPLSTGRVARLQSVSDVIYDPPTTPAVWHRGTKNAVGALPFRWPSRSVAGTSANAAATMPGLLQVMFLERSFGRTGPFRPTNVADRECLLNKLAESRPDVEPRSHVLRFFLEPDDLLEVGIRLDDPGNCGVLERGKLLDPDDGNSRCFVPLGTAVEVDRNLSAAEHKSGHLVAAILGARVVHHGPEGAAGEFLRGGGGHWVPEQALGCHQDQRARIGLTVAGPGVATGGSTARRS